MNTTGPHCLRCHDTHVFIHLISGQRYARARRCDCTPSPCPTCDDSRFVLRYDEHDRETAIPCPECGSLNRRLELFNEARIPKRYLHSRLHAQDQDEENSKAFGLLEATLRSLPHRLRQTESQNTGPILKGMVLMGPPGTGKTHLMSGFTYQCTVELGVSCVFQGFSELLHELRQGYSNDKSDMEIIEPHLQADVLVIDDLGKGRNSDWELSILDTLISERYNRDRLIMVTTNYTEHEETTLQERVLRRDRGESEQFMADTLRRRVGERIYSRLREMCYFEELLGRDRRQDSEFDKLPA